MRCRVALLTVVLGGSVCSAAHAASVPLAQSGRALRSHTSQLVGRSPERVFRLHSGRVEGSEEPSVSSRAIALAEGESTPRSPRWIVYLPDGGFTRTPARLSRAYRVDTSRAVFLVQPNAPR